MKLFLRTLAYSLIFLALSWACGVKASGFFGGGGGSGSGIATYANLAAFPPCNSGIDGSVAIALDTYTMYTCKGGTTTWAPISSPSTPLAVGSLDGGTLSANGGAISGGNLYFQSASSLYPGLVNTTTQTFQGAKTFVVAPTFASMGTGLVHTDSSGVTSSSTLVNADVSASAAIDASKIANGLVSNAEFQYLDGVTSAIQTQLNAKETALTFSTGLTRSVNTITVNTSQNIATLSNLTTNGFVKTSGGTGTLSVDTNTYLTGNQSITLSGDVSGSGATAITTAIGANKVLDTMIRQSAGLSIVGRSASTTGNVADITGTADQVCRVAASGASMGFGSIDLSKSAAVGSSILPVANGGTNLASYTSGDVPYASGTTTISKLAIGTTNQVLLVSSSLPAWSNPIDVQGSRQTGTSMSVGTAITASVNKETLVFVVGNGGAVTITASPPVVTSGMTVGQKLKICGTSDTNTVTYTSGNNLRLNGSAVLSKDYCINLQYAGTDGTNAAWIESGGRNF